MADDRERESERTTIVTTDGDGRGSMGIILLVALVVILLLVLFFGGVFDRDDDSALNVEVNTPDVNVLLPENQAPPVIVVPEGQLPPPDVNVNVTTPPPEPPMEGNGADAVTNSG